MWVPNPATLIVHHLALERIVQAYEVVSVIQINANHVIRFADILILWQNFKIVSFFEGLITIWQHLEPTLA